MIQPRPAELHLRVLIGMQVKNDLPESAISQTLISLVKLAAADQFPLAAMLAGDNLKLWQGLLVSDPQVAVLAAETLCRVCGQNLEPWTCQIAKLLPMLLHVVRYKGAGLGPALSEESAPTDAGSNPGASKQVPLLFFTISTLVRLSGVEELALGIVRQGGVQDLVEALDVSNSAICQVSCNLELPSEHATESGCVVNAEQQPPHNMCVSVCCMLAMLGVVLQHTGKRFRQIRYRCAACWCSC